LTVYKRANTWRIIDLGLFVPLLTVFRFIILNIDWTWRINIDLGFVLLTVLVLWTSDY
jgi:hypothetical protein